MATAVLVTGSATKAAGDSVRMPIDMGNEPSLINGARIASYNVTCSGAGAPTVTAKQMDYYYQISALLVGGSPGSYEVVFSVVLDDPDATTLFRTAVLKNL